MYYFKTIIICITCILLLFPSLSKSEGYDRPRIAIIGGGIGGTTAAYELSQLAAKHNLNFDLDLYEPGEIGGRLATSFVNGFEFEVGGSVIHNENMYMRNYAEKFNLSKYREPEDYVKADFTGFYDGKEFVYLQSRYELWSIVKLWWRYGWDLISFSHNLIDPLLNHFKRIYQCQKNGETFDDVHSLLSAMDSSFPPLLKVKLEDLLAEQGYSERFVKEIVFLATNVNYNQNTDIHAFVGSVALAGAQEALWSVQGGNKQVPQALLAQSDADLIQKRVQSIYLMPNSKYSLQAEDHSYIYDYVIVACPIIENSENNIKFEGFLEPIRIPVEYQKTEVTLVHGVLNHTFFHYDSQNNFPNNIFSVNNDLFFNSISVLNPVTPDKLYDRKVFKVFSKLPLTEDQLDSLFSSSDNVTILEWLAYPLYDTNDKNLTFVLHKNLFYVNGIEWAASAMEMSALSGVNAALHVLKKIVTQTMEKVKM